MLKLEKSAKAIAREIVDRDLGEKEASKLKIDNIIKYDSYKDVRVYLGNVATETMRLIYGAEVYATV